jgi:hypothetical protein
MDKIIFSAENSYCKHTIELSEQSGLDELYNAFKAILIGLTYDQKTIDNYIVELAETIIPNEV